MGDFDNENIKQSQLVLFSDTGKIVVKAYAKLHYIFVTGQQLKEPIAWGGPIVMNTKEELELAFQELDKGTFIKT